MHGHSFRGEVAVRGTIDPAVGWLIDFADLKRAVDPIVDRLDHYLLNEIDGLDNPTSELLAIWIWNHLAPNVPQLYRITIEETCSSRCHYYGGGGLGGGSGSAKDSLFYESDCQGQTSS